ncbi:MFS transporter [Streptomyces cinnamoneus]|uniref:MFS transporter n=1 Tax=Streptomyces cinnamoneus TaxID=53446 RepID=A0A2G1XLB1_STRCJ|nr:MFS transporter [Streptomyces cinnamoneus]PPT11923.1 MFS transporter [Streptomyces cinnamoneus]
MRPSSVAPATPDSAAAPAARPVRGLLGRRKNAAAEDRSPWRCLRSRSMRWWSAANLVSNLGTWMQLTVQNLLVLQLTGSAATTGLSLSVQAAPGLLFGLLGGAVVDRWPRKVTAAVSQALLAAVAFATALLVAFGALNVPVLMVLAGITGLIATVDGPATALLGNDLVPEKDVPSAIALGSVVHSAGRLAGTALAAVGIATVGTAGAYAVNGVSFLFVTAVIPFLRLQPHAREEALAAAARPRGAAAEDGRGGLAFFLSRRSLVALAVIAAVSAVLGRNYQLTLATLVTGPLHGGAGAYGLVSALLAVGGIAGAVVAGRLRRPTVRLVALLAAAGALLQIVAGLSPVLLMLLVMVVPMAIVESVSDTATTTVLQTDPPAHMRGRVLGVWRSVSTAWGLAGPPLLGLLVQGAGERGALVLGGALIVGVIGAGALAHRRRRTAARRPAPVLAPEAAFQTAA